MEPNKKNNSQQNADTIARQYRASTLAAEIIENAEPQTSSSTPNTQRRSKEADFAYLDEFSAPDAYAPTNEKFSAGAYTDKTLHPQGIGKREVSPQPEILETTEPSPNYLANRRRHLRQANRNFSGKNAVSTIFDSGQMMVRRARVSAINVTCIASWGWALWLLQVIFGILGIISIGIVAGIDALTSTEGGFFAWITGTVTGAINEILKFVGIDFAEIAMYVFIATYAVILTVGALMVATLYLQYKLAMVNPIFGNGSGFKFGMLMLTFIGIATPVLNLFPVILLWMVAVWLYPR
jgi:hypothetical protein